MVQEFLWNIDMLKLRRSGTIQRVHFALKVVKNYTGKVTVLILVDKQVDLLLFLKFAFCISEIEKLTSHSIDLD